MIRIICGILLWKVSALAAVAATFTVTNINDSGAGSLRQAILNSNSAAGSDTVDFDSVVFSSPQTITLASVITISPAAGDSLTITGPGASLLTISGGGTTAIFNRNPNFAHGLSVSGLTLTMSTADVLRNTAAQTLTVTNVVFLSNSGAIESGGALTVTGCTFTSNTAPIGGAINNSGPLTVTGCAFTDNVANGGGATGTGGGAIYNASAPGDTITVSDSTFAGNMQTAGTGPAGGAIRNRLGTMNVTNSTFSNNTALNGGGAISNSEVLTISDSSFTNNSADASGGAISNQGAGVLTISDSVISDNSTATHGGGIYYQTTAGTPSLSVINSTISGNTANLDNNTDGDGGGLFLGGVGSVTITGSTINGNTANTGPAGATSGDGGGIDASVSTTITNSTVSGNTTGRDGGGIYASGGSSAIIELTNSTIVNNRAVRDGGGVVRASAGNPVNFRSTIVANNIDDGTAPDVFGTVNSNGFNLIENTTGATITGATSSNIIGADPNLGPLQDNDGPTLTHAFLGASAAIDKGHSSGATTDQRGMPRPFDQGIPNAPGGDGADIGAFETDRLAPTFIVTNDADSGPGSLRDALTQANSNAQPDTIAFDPAFFATARTIVLASEIQITADGANPGHEVIIDGPGADLVIVSGNNAVRPFYVGPNASVVMNGMTIRDGNGVGTVIESDRPESRER